MNVILIPPADKELDDAIRYYNDQLYGLGDQFYNEFLDTMNLVERTPFGWRKVGENTRRINLKRFPYLVLYVIDEDDILVTCIAHQHRNPRYYIDRII
ncbi:MAG: type II toxin-antitoxin system RelE/ParE family toxin [Candidatus Hodarchaeota archaeon]